MLTVVSAALFAAGLLLARIAYVGNRLPGRRWWTGEAPMLCGFAPAIVFSWGFSAGSLALAWSSRGESGHLAASGTVVVGILAGAAVLWFLLGRALRRTAKPVQDAPVASAIALGTGVPPSTPPPASPPRRAA